jgi:hypothetical protein
MFKTIAMNLAKEALWAVLAAVWIAGLIHQFESLSMTAGYLAISLAMCTVIFGGQFVLKFKSRRARRW